MMEATYTLTCEGCREAFYSEEAFPSLHYCTKCSAIFKAGEEKVVEWIEEHKGEEDFYIVIAGDDWQSFKKERGL